MLALSVTCSRRVPEPIYPGHAQPAAVQCRRNSAVIQLTTSSVLMSSGCTAAQENVFMVSHHVPRHCNAHGISVRSGKLFLAQK